MDSFLRETGIAVRSLTKATSRIELERLEHEYKNNATKHWATLPVGVDLNIYKAKRASAYYIILISDGNVIGYLLLIRTKLQTEAGDLAGWTVAHSFILPQVRKIGLMRRVYDLILSKGRMISSPVHTPQAVTMWVNRIKTDNRHLYLLVTGSGKSQQVLVVDAQSIDSMKRAIWDGDIKTLLLCCQKNDQKVKKILLRIAKQKQA